MPEYTSHNRRTPHRRVLKGLFLEQPETERDESNPNPLQLAIMHKKASLLENMRQGTQPEYVDIMPDSARRSIEYAHSPTGTFLRGAMAPVISVKESRPELSIGRLFKGAWYDRRQLGGDILDGLEALAARELPITEDNLHSFVSNPIHGPEIRRRALIAMKDSSITKNKALLQAAREVEKEIFEARKPLADAIDKFESWVRPEMDPRFEKQSSGFIEDIYRGLEKKALNLGISIAGPYAAAGVDYLSKRGEIRRKLLEKGVPKPRADELAAEAATANMLLGVGLNKIPKIGKGIVEESLEETFQDITSKVAQKHIDRRAFEKAEDR